METIERIRDMLQRCTTGGPVFPCTVLYNEDWLLRLVLDWFSRHQGSKHPFEFFPGATWYSQALLPSHFSPRYRGDAFGEAWTHADGVIGHFAIGRDSRTDLTLLREAKALIVIEAKLYSRLSPGITHAPYYDQAARTVACMAETLERAQVPPSNMEKLGFYAIAPKLQIDKRAFKDCVTSESIKEKVHGRAGEYEATHNDWYEKWFLPMLERMSIQVVSWEQTLAYIRESDPDAGEVLGAFYGNCLKYNAPAYQ